MIRKRQRDSRSDEALVDICNHGDGRAAAAAFETLYLRHKDYVLRVAWRFTPDMDTALDVLQDTFVQLLRRFPPAGEGITLTAKLTTLLYPIAKNTAITAQRKAARFPVAADITPDDMPAARDRDNGDLHKALSTLPPGQHEALTLRFVDGMSLAEIAQALDIPQGTVKSRLHGGIARLRDSHLLKDFFD
ncbi:MAG: sigma-70 family RNA polymerase sigma factor [Gammaproteobacteria bacterium]|nr:sigma-70 family RNA polymerase sigma factor [Gammaproteobacteria bacterium]MCY4211586.1 sigma-70 family RNA polymerase sigma factor [Gammaproteobacteria bacterium]MCY4282677.1 sigma-70 family RNA polymerase sigma factor [Gammaproteobacteria bacterium]